MKKKGFTLVELLVVIAIIAMLLAILMPALAKVKTLAYQMLCGTNLKGISNAILVYGQDNNEKYPVSGVSGVVWQMPKAGSGSGGSGIDWEWEDPAKPAIQNAAYGAKSTVSACLYLLVKYADVSPSSFVCKAGKQKKLNLASLASDEFYTGTALKTGTTDVTQCWDFTTKPQRYCSYAYAFPWDTSKLMSSATKAGVAVVGDLNPWMQEQSTGAVGFQAAAATTTTDAPQLIGAAAALKSTWPTGNSLTHEQAGQNVLFNDMHVEFTKQPNADSAVQNDNIYTPWDTTNTNETPRRGKGKQPNSLTVGPQSKEDSYLVQW
jgi:prepilin-type N-terminal cleavage/methylation domain-containing protein